MNRSSAFSLVELSIVLVILGLLTGGILAGQSLIRAAELRAVSTEYQRYVAASRAFQDKYFAIAGDFRDATKFWTTDPGGCPGNNTTATTPRSATCDGDGNGSLNWNVSTSQEIYRYWQQLANAGLVEGSFTGVANSASASFTNSITTPNVPRSKLANAMWSINNVGTQDVASATYFDGSFGNAFHFTNGSYDGAVIKPEEAWNIDTKLDDGKPGLGSVQSLKNAAQANASTGCSNVAYSSTVSIAASSAYLLTNTASACSLIFKSGF